MWVTCSTLHGSSGGYLMDMGEDGYIAGIEGPLY